MGHDTRFQQAKLPKLRVAIRMAAKNSPAIVFDSKIVKKLFTLNEIELMVGKFGSIATRKSAFSLKVGQKSVCSSRIYHTNSVVSIS